jgi:sugar lactone lactonase YvrE
VDLELVHDARADLGEGPVWDQRTGELIWVDINAAVVHRFDPSSGSDRPLPVGAPVGAVCPRAAGGYVVALQDGIAAVSESGEITVLAEIEADVATNRFNDAKCDPAGRLWAGTLRLDYEPGGALYRIDRDHSVTRVLTGVGLSNGLGWSPEGDAMYFIDSLAGSLDVFEFDGASGSVAGRQRLVSFPEDDGLPDGMTVDSEGHLWVAVYGGGVVRRYEPSGALVLELELPVSQPTSCTFGGADLGDLYITSAAQFISPDKLAREPSAGGLFRCRPGVVGVPAVPFAG